MSRNYSGFSEIAAVVVTYNGLQILRDNLNALRNQTYHIDKIIIVNNSSTDGTTEWLNEQPDIVHILQSNSGSSGGQYTGIKHAWNLGARWIWCLDHDVIPAADALESMMTSSAAEEFEVGFMTSLINAPDGNIAHINVPYIKSFSDILQAIAAGKALPVISASFGSVLFSREAVSKCGLPCKSFFIWGDDVEYTMRMIKNGFKGFLISESCAVHHMPSNVPEPISEMHSSDFKTALAIKNTVYTIKLRNQLLYGSRLRSIISIIDFVIRLMNRKYRLCKFQDSLFYFKLVKYSIVGMLFNPDPDEISRNV